MDDVDDADDEDEPGNNSEAGPWSNGLADDMAPGCTKTPIPICHRGLFQHIFFTIFIQL